MAWPEPPAAEHAGARPGVAVRLFSRQAQGRGAVAKARLRGRVRADRALRGCKSLVLSPVRQDGGQPRPWPGCPRQGRTRSRDSAGSSARADRAWAAPASGARILSGDAAGGGEPSPSIKGEPRAISLPGDGRVIGSAVTVAWDRGAVARRGPCAPELGREGKSRRPGDLGACCNHAFRCGWLQTR